jgi:predicted enzyme involved in methoxymalonyl-ACP biosynthesis
MARDHAFVELLKQRTLESNQFSEVLALSTLRRKAQQVGLWPAQVVALRLAVIGGFSLRPLVDVIEHFALTLGNVDLKLWTGDFDNYISEVMDEASGLYEFHPEIVLILPSERRCRYKGRPSDPLEVQEAAANQLVFDLLDWAKRIYSRSGAAVIIANFRLPSAFDPGPMRNSGLSSEYAFR